MSFVSKFPRRQLALVAAIVSSLAFALIATVAAPASAATKNKTTAAEPTLTGTITAANGYGFTVKVPGRATGVIAQLTSAADNLTAQDWPYVWGGGHMQAGIPSVGVKGDGNDLKHKGFDCSGSVAAVLVAGGLWPAGGSVPSDNGVISEMQSAGEIASGAGTGPDSVTLYDDPGVHIFMNIAGRFFGTSDGDTDGDKKGGPGWLTGYPYDATTSAFKRYHVLTSRLHTTSTAGETVGFSYSSAMPYLPAGFTVGANVAVSYKTTSEGTMAATAITYGRTYTMSGVVDTVTSVPTPGAPSSTQMTNFRITNGNRKRFAFAVGSQKIPALRTGDAITVTYARPPAIGSAKSAWVAVAVKVTDSVSPDSGGVGA